LFIFVDVKRLRPVTTFLKLLILRKKNKVHQA